MCLIKSSVPFLCLILFISLFACKSESSELRKKAASEIQTKTANQNNANALQNNNTNQTNDQYGSDLKTMTLFTVNWILRIKENGSGSFGQGQNGNLYAMFPAETFDYQEVLQTLSSAIEESGSFGQSIAFTVSGGAKVQKPNYIENFDYCKSLFNKAYSSLEDEEKLKVKESFAKIPPVSAYSY